MGFLLGVADNMAVMLFASANSLTTWPAFPPCIPCSRATELQLMGVPVGQFNKVVFSFSVSQDTLLKLGACGLGLFGCGGV